MSYNILYFIFNTYLIHTILRVHVEPCDEIDKKGSNKIHTGIIPSNIYPSMISYIYTVVLSCSLFCLKCKGIAGQIGSYSEWSSRACTSYDNINTKVSTVWRVTTGVPSLKGREWGSFLIETHSPFHPLSFSLKRVSASKPVD